MRSLLLGVAIVFVSGSAMAADRGDASAGAKAVQSYISGVVAHEAEMDENGCHVARRKRHSEHCHEAEAIDRPVDTVDAAGTMQTVDADG